MPPKVDPNDPSIKAITDLFSTISFTGPKALETTRNPKHVEAIRDAIHTHKLDEAGLDAKQGQFVVTAVINSGGLDEKKRRYLVERTAKGDLDSDDRVKTAIKYLSTVNGPVDDAAFDEACGVGVVVTREQVGVAARRYVDGHKAELEKRGRPNLSTMLAALKGVPELRWASTLDIKNAGEELLKEVWPAPVGGEEKKASKKAPAPAAAAAKPAAASEATEDPEAMFKEGFLSKLHAPGENPQVHPTLKQQHLSATRGRVFTRFPPEPNGYLHIGHTKAIAIDFGYAKHHNGLCYLRFDDTNPEAEEGKYFDSILATVRWLGFEPWRITYSSDYFQQLYELAVRLIQKGKAYVDHSTAEEVQEERGGRGGERRESKWRNRPVEENLREFEAMKEVSRRSARA